VHQVLGDALRTFELEEQDLDETDPWTPFLAATAFAIRSTCHTTLGTTPAQLVFQRDMILPMKFQADWMRMCCFAQDNLECLGYQLTREGVQPQPQKMEASMREGPLGSATKAISAPTKTTNTSRKRKAKVATKAMATKSAPTVASLAI